jgi:hypothetical protein
LHIKGGVMMGEGSLIGGRWRRDFLILINKKIL